MRIVRVLLVVLLLCMVAGCSRSPVADDLAQREANEIVAVLREHGIEATVEKQKGGKGRYSVQVSSQQFGESASLLASLGLPEERKPGFSDLVSSGGILPSSREVESLRLDRASAAELEELLKGLPAVSSASVVVRSHGLAVGVAPSVSAVVQTKPGSVVSADEVKSLLARTVPGLNPSEIVLSVAEQMVVATGKGKVSGASREGDSMIPFLIFWKVPQDQYAGLATLVVCLLLVVSAVAGLVGYVMGQYFLSRSAEFQSPAGNTASSLQGNAPLNRISGPVVDRGGEVSDDDESIGG